MAAAAAVPTLPRFTTKVVFNKAQEERKAAFNASREERKIEGRAKVRLQRWCRLKWLIYPEAVADYCPLCGGDDLHQLNGRMELCRLCVKPGRSLGGRDGDEALVVTAMRAHRELIATRFSTVVAGEWYAEAVKIRAGLRRRDAKKKQ